MIKRLVTAFLLVTLIFAAGCSGDTGASSNQAAGEELVVAATIYPVWYFTSRVCGDQARVVQMLPDGADPHEWEPTPGDMADLARADVFVYNGAGMEGWVNKVLNNLDKETAAIDCSAGIAATPSQEGVGADPHLWLDPVLAMQMVDNIAGGMAQAAPDNAEYFKANARQLQEDLQRLHEQYEDTLARAGQRKFVVSHAAFGYLARRYGLEQVAVAGLTHEAQPGPARVAEIIDLIREHDIKYVLAEELQGGRAVRAIAGETGAGILTLNPLGGLTPEDRDAGRDYLSVMEDNLAALSRALEVE